MTILEINKFYYKKGGAETHFLSLIEILRKKGHKVIPFSMKSRFNLPSSYSQYFINEVDFDRLSIKNIFKIFYNWDAVRKLKKLLKNEKIDIAHLHNIAHHISPAIINVLKKHRIPIIQTLHDYKMFCPAYTAWRQGQTCYSCLRGNYYKCLLHRCHKGSYLKSFLVMLEAYWSNKVLKAYHKVDLFIAPSKFMKDFCLSFGIEENKVKVLKNFSPFSDDYSLPMVKAGDYFLYFGRLSSEKGVLPLVKIFKDLPFKLKIAGRGKEENNIKQFIQTHKLGRRIELLGWQEKKDLINLILGARAVISPSLANENMPLNILEAMNLGKVVIATRVGGIPEIIKDGDNGFLFNPNDFTNLEKIIVNLDKYNLARIGARAQRSADALNSEGYYFKLIKVMEILPKKQDSKSRFFKNKEY